VVCTCLVGCGADPKVGADPTIAVLAAFPAELDALVRRAEIHESIPHGQRVFRTGRLAGVRVVLAMTGIGLENATATTRTVLDRFAIDGVVVSGVAGGSLLIGDVAVPQTWTLDAGIEYRAHEPWLREAEAVAVRGLALERCTAVPSTGEPVCLEHAPVIVVGGDGESGDPFGGEPSACFPAGDDVFGCDISALAVTAQSGGVERALSNGPMAVDMETAAIAREADARGLPFIAFRALSDGAGDPLGLPGFPGQFFAYYRLAAENAARATTAFLERLARPTGTPCRFGCR